MDVIKATNKASESHTKRVSFSVPQKRKSDEIENAEIDSDSTKLYHRIRSKMYSPIPKKQRKSKESDSNDEINLDINLNRENVKNKFVSITNLTVSERMENRNSEILGELQIDIPPPRYEYSQGNLLKTVDKNVVETNCHEDKDMNTPEATIESNSLIYSEKSNSPLNSNDTGFFKNQESLHRPKHQITYRGCKKTQ